MKSITLFLSFLILSLTLHTPLVIAGTFNTTYVYDEKDLVARKELWHNKTFYYYPDHLGSTSVVVNETGAVVEETTYEPFGKVVSGGSDRFLYTGKELDPGTGLEYYGARYYDPAKASQFITPDSVISDIYNPQSLNRYAYVLNNPYKYTDESGNVVQAAVVIPILAVGLVSAIFSFGYTYSETGDLGKSLTAGGIGFGSGVGLATTTIYSGGSALFAFGGYSAIGGFQSIATQTFVEGRDVNNIDNEKVGIDMVAYPLVQQASNLLSKSIPGVVQNTAKDATNKNTDSLVRQTYSNSVQETISNILIKPAESLLKNTFGSGSDNNPNTRVSDSNRGNDNSQNNVQNKQSNQNQQKTCFFICW